MLHVLLCLISLQYSHSHASCNYLAFFNYYGQTGSCGKTSVQSYNLDFLKLHYFLDVCARQTE